jgi:hypothetical protein
MRTADRLRRRLQSAGDVDGGRRTKLTSLTALCGAGAAAVAFLAAPVAAADPGQSCSASSANGSGTVCQTPGNAQINDTPPPVSFFPYGGYGLALGVTGAR